MDSKKPTAKKHIKTSQMPDHTSGILYFLKWGAGLFVIISFVFLVGCEENNSGGKKEGFDRTSMLQNYANNIIVPNYQVLKSSVDSLYNAAETFASAPATVSLEQLRQAWYNAAIDWQHCSTFEFGPAFDVLLRASMNTFPTDKEQIEANIASGSYNLEAATNIDATGLPALDYLLYGTGESDEAVVDMFVSDDNAENRKQYLMDVVTQMQTKTTSVYNEWSSDGDNYIEMFVEATGTDLGSSLGALVNQINFDFEIIKNAKIGIPLGEKTLGSPLPGNVEAYYAGPSIDFAVEHVKAIQLIFNGTSRQGNDSTGIGDHLNHLGAQHSSGIPLAEAINDQFVSCIEALEAIPPPLSNAVENHSMAVSQAHTELKKQVVLLKTDMPSALSVLITYQDNDGD